MLAKPDVGVEEVVDAARAASLVLDAWIERRVAVIRVADFRRAATDGRVIVDDVDGECLLTRSLDGQTVLLSGKRFRAPWFKRSLHNAIREELARRGLRFESVKPRGPTPWASSSDLELAWLDKKQWASRNPAAVYSQVAREVVNAWATGGVWRFRLTDLWVAASAGDVHVIAECILTDFPATGIALLSGVNYRRGSHCRGVRDAVRIELENRGIAFRQLRPLHRSNCTTPEDLRSAWGEQPLRVVGP